MDRTGCEDATFANNFVEAHDDVDVLSPFLVMTNKYRVLSRPTKRNLLGKPEIIPAVTFNKVPNL